MDDRVARQEAIDIVATSLARPETLLRIKSVSSSGHRVCVRYVPDRYFLPEGSFQVYLSSIPEQFWSEVHEAAFVVLDDLTNQLVPKWIQVSVETDSHAALIEDRQPQWQNAALLSRQVFF